MWGGIECTINRVGDAFHDQCAINGHDGRDGDLELLSGLGITALRYPVLWERVAPNGLESADWALPTRRLNALRELGLRPIVGLVHHGSGPRELDLLSDAFAPSLAKYAAAVAERFPWLVEYTPVNEPLTTARFSALYGHWYPHRCCGQAFARAVVNQCRATVLAMEAIRRVNPAARLIQTEDLGKTYSTTALAYQADYENERRWFSLDLLTGRFGPRSRLWPEVVASRVSVDELLWFQDHLCSPSILGFNYYVTSQRFLDDRLALYPKHTHGGNGRHQYADVEAVRVCEPSPIDLAALLREASARYQLPLAITEAHLGGHREAQLRWLVEVWNAACDMRQEGHDVRAVAVWALLGSFDWNTLVTQRTGYYESGVFDVRSDPPRATALATVVADLAKGERPRHPALDGQSWWQHPGRLLCEPYRCEGVCSRSTDQAVLPSLRPLLILGASGTLGKEFSCAAQTRGLHFVAIARSDLNIGDAAAIRQTFDAYRPWAVVNAAGSSRIEEAEVNVEPCQRSNVTGPITLATECASYGLQLLTFSSDLVFDGRRREPYLESHSPCPLNAFGRAQASAERAVALAWPRALIVRTSTLFGPRVDPGHRLPKALLRLAAGGAVRACDRCTISPTLMPDLVHACLDLVIDGETGLWHLTNRGESTWAELIARAAAILGVNHSRLTNYPRALPGRAARPEYSVLGSERGCLLPSLDDALERCIAEAVRTCSTLRPQSSLVEHAYAL